MIKTNFFKTIILITALFFISITKCFGEEIKTFDKHSEIEKQILKMEKRLKELQKKKREENGKDDKGKKDKSFAIDKSLISAVGKKYVLLSPGIVGVEYSLAYEGKSFDSIESAEESGTFFEKESTHTLTNKVTIEYPIKENLSFQMSIPYVSVYDDKQGQNTDIDDFGDPYLGILFQPITEKHRKPALVLSAGITAPMGRSPYELNSQTGFPTGEGVYTANLGINLSKKYDPALIYGGIFYSYKFEKGNLTYKNSITLGETGEQLERVKPGDEFGFNAGTGYVLSEDVSISLGCKFIYQTPSNYYWRGRKRKSSSYITKSKLLMGTAWQITEKRRVFLDLGIGLSNNDEDFSIELRLPFNFIL